MGEGGELVAGEDASAMKAEEDSGGMLGKDFAAEVAPDEEDGDFLRNASAAAHNLWWQARGQRSDGVRNNLVPTKTCRVARVRDWRAVEIRQV